MVVVVVVVAGGDGRMRMVTVPFAEESSKHAVGLLVRSSLNCSSRACRHLERRDVV